jgi:hypothetical protein
VIKFEKGMKPGSSWLVEMTVLPASANENGNCVKIALALGPGDPILIGKVNVDELNALPNPPFVVYDRRRAPSELLGARTAATLVNRTAYLATFLVLPGRRYINQISHSFPHANRSTE